MNTHSKEATIPEPPSGALMALGAVREAELPDAGGQEKRSDMPPKTLPHRSWMPVVLLVLGLLSVAMLFWIDHLTEGERKSFAIESALMDAQISASIFHLSLEESIATHLERDREMTWSALNHTRALFGSLLDGGKTEHDPIRNSLSDPAKRAQARELRTILDQMATMGREREDAAASSGIGSPHDQRFDELFMQFMGKAKALEWSAEHDRLKDQTRARRLFTGVLVVWGFIIFTATAGFWGLERKRRSAAATLQSANEQLNLQASQLTMHRKNLAELVEARTAQIMTTNRELQKEIVERKRAEEELENSREALRALAAHLQSIREEERTRLSREIHDQLGLALTMLNMDISWLEEKLPTDATTRNPALAARLATISSRIDETVALVRRIATELRPGILDDIGLIAAIEWQTRDFEERTGIRSELDGLPQADSMAPDGATALFRIYQEILANVARHAGATEIQVRAKAESDRFVLEVRDNGKGITQAEMTDPKSLGLLGMRERAATAGGGLEIHGAPGRGTTVVVWIPHRSPDESGKERFPSAPTIPWRLS